MSNNVLIIVLYISTFITLGFLFILLKIKDKKTLHFISIITVLVVFLWCLLSIAEQHTTNNTVILTNCIASVSSFLPCFLFLFGYSYAKSISKLDKKLYWIFLIPILKVILVWTNEHHFLLYQNYSLVSSERMVGPIFPFFLISGIFLDAFGFFYLAKFSIKNSGFFSKQSMIIIIGILFPFVIDLIAVLNIFPIPFYSEPIAFSIAIIFFSIAIFKFGFLSIVPIALQTVVDHISDSYIVINENFEIIDFNKTFTYTFKDIVDISRKITLRDLYKQLEIISIVSYDDLANLIEKSTKSHKSISFENQFLSDSIDKTFTIEITPIFAKSTYRGTIILFKDITEQKQSFEKIRQAQFALIKSDHLASLGQMIGGIAHNFKTPIMSISGGLEALSDLTSEYDESIGDSSITPEDHHDIASDMREWIGKIKEYCSYMSDIITTVKGQAVQLTASTTDKFLLSELLKRVDILMNHELKMYGCSLDVQNQIDIHTEIKGEVNSLVQVINNLITNSIHAYEGKKGVVEFIITKADKMVQLVVKDFGCGMTDEVKSKLFKEMITTKAKSGTGLGLYMSYSTICGRFGGKMWFESELNKGTAFYVQVPAI